MEKEYKWMVRVDCMTFNHASYIEDAMNGFCMQETDFPFVCTIIDDASTDGELNVIKKYLEEHFDLKDRTIVRNEETEDYTLIFARHKTNRNCYFAVLFLKYNHYSIKKDKMPYIAEWQENCKYIAYCEGDDYWIDSEKLQKQVDFLEKNEDYVLSCTAFRICNTAQQKIGGVNYQQNSVKTKHSPILSSYDVLTTNRIVTLTVLCRCNSYIKAKRLYPTLFSGHFLMGDRQLWYALSRIGKIHYNNEQTSIYRITPNSVTHQYDPEKFYRFLLSSCELKLQISSIDMFPRMHHSIFRKAYDNAYFKYKEFEGEYKPLYKMDKRNVDVRLKILKAIGILKAILIYRCHHAKIFL